jgi:hypothetical protein
MTSSAKARASAIRLCAFDSSNWTKVLDDLVVPAGHDSDNNLGLFCDSPFLLDTRTAITGQWRYVKSDTVGNSDPNWSDGSATGLAEVQFFDTFIPALPDAPKGTTLLFR